MNEETKQIETAAEEDICYPYCPLLRQDCLCGSCAWYDAELKQKCAVMLAAERIDLLAEMAYDKLKQEKLSWTW